jgi:hypothetical protein
MGNSLSPVANNIFMENFEHLSTIPLNGSDTSTTLSWFDHMDQQDCSWYFNLNSLRPTIKFGMEVKVNDIFLFLEVLVMKRGHKFVPKVYRKRTHTCSYLHFKCHHSHHVKMRVVHSLLSRPKVICQDKKDFNKEIKNIRYDLKLTEYPQEFFDSIMKPSRSNRLFSDTIYQGTVITPYVKSISEKIRCIGNRFYYRTI